MVKEGHEKERKQGWHTCRSHVLSIYHLPKGLRIINDFNPDISADILKGWRKMLVFMEIDYTCYTKYIIELPVEENLRSPFENLSKIWSPGAVVLGPSQPGPEKVQE